jgi:undecaprenyl-diphosphatase
MADVYPTMQRVHSGVVARRAVSLVPDRGEAIEPALSKDATRRWGAYSGVVVIGWLAVLVSCVGVGALITGPLHSTSLLRWDRRYPSDLEAARTATGNDWSGYGSLMGDTLTVIAIAVVVGVTLLVLRRWASVILLTTAMLCEVSIFVLTTIAVPRDRPNVEQLDVSPPTSSFPSGHSAAATALALSLAIIVGWQVRTTFVRVFVWIVAVIVGPIVGISRLYRGMHHPLDVLVGLGLGVACVLVAYLAVRAWVGEESVADQGNTDLDAALASVGKHARPPAEPEGPADSRLVG